MPTSHLKQLSSSTFGLFCDLYHLTMAYGFWKSGIYNKNAIYHLFYRKNPFQHPYAIACGLDLALELIENFRFSEEDILFLGQLKGNNNKALFDESFLNYLQRFKLEVDISAIPEGTVVFPHQPLLRVKGPLIHAQLIESALLNVINFSTLIATKSARMIQASQGEAVLEFGMRRAQGMDGAITASRAAYIGGCHATSNVLAGRLYNIPVKGTHAHSWVMSFEDELTSFYEYAKAMPNNCIFLVDTFDTIAGIEKAIEVGNWLRSTGHQMVGIRLDSGDLGGLSLIAREMLDEAGFKDAVIVASDSLDEHKIEFLKNQRAAINVWGVGTNLVTAKGNPALGGVYKLSAIEDGKGHWNYKIKLSENPIKISNPGSLAVRRYWDNKDVPLADQIYDPEIGQSNSIRLLKDTRILSLQGATGEDLLIEVMKKGKRTYSSPSIHEIRKRSLTQQRLFAHFEADGYPVGLEDSLWALKQELIAKSKV